MGMAASQIRLLSLTAGIHNVEYQAQQIQSAKLQLALQEDEVYRRYNDALDEQTLTFRNQAGNLVSANFNNLFGKDSIKNGLGADYTLWASNGELVVPDDVYEAYSKYGGKDPYAFAMSMLGVDVTEPRTFDDTGNSYTELEYAEKTFLKNNENIVNSAFGSIFKTRDDILQQVADIIEAESITDIDGYPNDINIQAEIGKTGISEKDNELLKELDKQFESVNEQYRHQLYAKYGEEILHSSSGNENAKFDYDTFNYYLRYAKMIEEEGGLTYVTHPSEYDDNFATDAELFNKMLMSGKLMLDIVSIDKSTGNVLYDPTSASSDTYLAYSNTSSVDSKALKKAEAEYEHAMKEINRKDKKYDMDLNRLETERKALTTEYDSVKNVIKENVERTFGIFS